MIPRPGQLLGGRYALTERIAVGGMGEVWRGVDTVMERPVAVKVLRADLDRDGPFLARFRAEARTAAMLSHPGIAAMYDFHEEHRSAYLVMELVPGEPLSTIISRDGALGVRRTLDLVAQTAWALQAAHRRGVVHRDVKPANLMVTPEGVIRVTDFGIARPQDHEPLTATGQVMGTAHYLAPEVARGQTATPASDVYALGIVAYECLAGRRPFDGANQVAVATAQLYDEPPPLPATLPRDVVAVIGAAMAKDPTERIGSAEQFAVALERLASNDPRALEGIRVPGRPTAPPSNGYPPQQGYGSSGYQAAGYGLAASSSYPGQAGQQVPGGYPAAGGYPATGRTSQQSPYSPGVAPTSQVPLAGGNGGPGTRPGGAVPASSIFPPTGTFRPAEYEFQRSYGGPGEDGDEPRRTIPKPLWAALAIVAAVGLIVLMVVLLKEPPGGGSVNSTSSSTSAGPTTASKTSSLSALGTPTPTPSITRTSRTKSPSPTTSSSSSSPTPSTTPSSPKPTTTSPTTTPTPTPTPSVTVSPTPSVPPPSSPAVTP